MQKSKFCPWSLAGALIFALCTVIGAHFAPFGKDVGGFGNRMDLLKYLPVFVVLTAVYYLVLHFLLNRTYAKKTEAPAGKFFQFYEKHVFLVSFLVIALAWIPYVITFYPGSVCFDGYFQLNQVAGVQPLTNKHPIMSTFILGFFFKLGRLVNDNFGVFLYIMFQLLASSAIYALSIRQIRRIGMSLKVCVLAVLYFALVPVWGAYIQAVVKDTLYAAVFVWFAVWCVTLADEVFHKDKNIQRKTLIMSFLTAFFVCVLRQNGKYIVLPTLVCLAAVSLKKWKQMVLLLLVFMFAITGYDKAVVPMFSTAQISRRAMFSVMFQQTAKYLRSYPEEVTEEEYEIIDKVLKADVIAEEYNPRVSNPVKNTFRNDTSNENVKEYLKVWFKMFWKHPGVYLEAFSPVLLRLSGSLPLQRLRSYFPELYYRTASGNRRYGYSLYSERIISHSSGRLRKAVDGNVPSDSFDLPGNLYLADFVLYSSSVQKEEMETACRYAHAGVYHSDKYCISGERMSEIYPSSYGGNASSSGMDCKGSTYR